MSNNRVIIGSVPGLQFFLHRLNPDRVAVQKETTRYPSGKKKKNKKTCPGQNFGIRAGFYSRAHELPNRGAAEKFDANRVIGFAFFWSGQNRVLFSVTRLPRLLLMPTFCPLKCGIFHGIPAKDSGGATIEDAPVVVEIRLEKNRKERK